MSTSSGDLAIGQVQLARSWPIRCHRSVAFQSMQCMHLEAVSTAPNDCGDYRHACTHACTHTHTHTHRLLLTRQPLAIRRIELLSCSPHVHKHSSTHRFLSLFFDINSRRLTHTQHDRCTCLCTRMPYRRLGLLALREDRTSIQYFRACATLASW